MQFGFFDDKQREYGITQAVTPQPWINYLGSEDFFSLISNTAGGYSFYRDARLRRLTRFRYNDAPLDEGSRFIYLRDENGEVWSPTGQPIRGGLDQYTCRHGLGYTCIQSSQKGIETEVCFFVPVDGTLEIWDMTISNSREKAAKIQLFSAVEFCLWDALDDSTNFQRNYSIGEVEVEGNIIYHKSEYRERRNHFAYFACSEPVAAFDTQRDAFLGIGNGWPNPQAVKNGRLTNSVAHGWQPIGAQQIDLLLQPGESRRIIFLLGYAENLVSEKFDPPDSQTINKHNVLPVIQRYLKPQTVDAAFLALKSYWNTLLDQFHVETPNPHVNRMVNIWNAYQCMVTFNMSRSASLFESGIGRGMGFRDSNQDLLGFVHMIPEKARARLLDLAATQLLNGGAFHQYQTLTKRGNNDIGSGFNDDPLWLVLAAAAYLKETGDWSILDEQVPFENQPGTEATFYTHLERAVQYTLDRIGPHGLPLIGRADWNDCLNLNCFSDTPGQSFQTTTNRDGKVAESVLIGGLFVLAAGEMASISALYANKSRSLFYRNAAQLMEKTVLDSGWDGAWFRRAYDDRSLPLGSQECKEGSIFIEPQGICIMAGIGLQDGKALSALDAVHERLATPHGIVLLNPAFTHYDLNYGEITSYPPGYKENAGVFCHTNPWIMIAETRVGRADRALDYYLRINPSAREGLSDLHRCEPYVYAQMIAGKDAPTHGEAKNSWLTGTAAWNFVAISQWILGIRPDWEGLRVEPALPSDWQGFTVVRKYRGVNYQIQVKRRGAGNSLELWADGIKMDGTIIPLPVEGTKEVKVQVFVR